MQLHDLLLGTLCLRTFSAIPEEVLNLRAFWRYNVQCGIAARTIGQYSKSESHHVFFTLGLLHEIGHAALFLKAPEVSLQTLEDAETGQRDCSITSPMSQSMVTPIPVTGRVPHPVCRRPRLRGSTARWRLVRGSALMSWVPIGLRSGCGISIRS